ncbi:MAG: CPBP family intramembrane metalloprotease [Actinomycetales bacterium]|nr:CPBP family intramembrane metalloprotease [Actinomycetales bacterium]
MRAVVRSAAARFFTVVWFAAVLVLALGGHDIPVLGIVVGLVLLFLSLLVTAATEPADALSVATGPARRRVWVQLALVAVFIALTGWNNLAFHNVTAEDAAIPLWTPMTRWLQRVGEEWFGEGLGNFVVNPTTYVLLPLLVLALAAARPSTLGFGKGHRVGRALLICCAIPLAWFAYTLIGGHQTIVRLSGRFASNFMQNGFLEEFLFRGLLQTRLRLIAGPGWALVGQALVFGVWHLGSGYASTDHAGLLPAIAITIVQQSLLGLALGILFERTRNLLVPSVVHIALNSMG